MHKYVFIYGDGTEEERKFSSHTEAKRYARLNADSVYRWYTVHTEECDWWCLGSCSCGAHEYDKGYY